LGAVGKAVRGVAAVPGSVGRGGKRWDGDGGRWVVENLGVEECPGDDGDILGKYEEDAEKDAKVKDAKVKDTKLYDVLGVSTTADDSTLKKNYYKKARLCHPDKHTGSLAKAQFQEISEAYQVLSDADLRSRYDADGADGLSADRTAGNDDHGSGKVDGGLLFACLFGSMQFGDFVGVTRLEREAACGEGRRVGKADGVELQRRRTLRLARILRKRLDEHIDEGKGDDMTDVGVECVALR